MIESRRRFTLVAVYERLLHNQCAPIDRGVLFGLASAIAYAAIGGRLRRSDANDMAG